jgi:hypothetical protein
MHQVQIRKTREKVKPSKVEKMLRINEFSRVKHACRGNDHMLRPLFHWRNKNTTREQQRVAMWTVYLMMFESANFEVAGKQC